MRTKYKQWAVSFLDEHPEVIIDKIDKSDPFLNNKKLHIEIGSGKGDFIISMAQKYPDISFIGVEKVKTVAGILSKKIIESKLNNVKCFPNDINILFSLLDDESVDKIYLNFVDPWPKKKHAKRRLTYITYLNEYYRILKKKSLVVFKSDNDSLFEFTLDEIQNSKFKLIESEENYEFNDRDAMSEYETKFRKLNQHIHRIVLKK